MSAVVEYVSNKTSEAEIAEHLSRCDSAFVPPLSGRVEIRDYAKKIARKAMRFEAWSGGTLVGLVAVYLNDQEKRIAYITSVSVLQAWAGKGIVARLMSWCVEYSKASGMRQINLEVAEDNTPAIRLYENNGFVAGKANAPFVTMSLNLGNGDEHEQRA
jgi:ribosomal protein S18 acetylase RimI-like enzyme